MVFQLCTTLCIMYYVSLENWSLVLCELSISLAEQHKTTGRRGHRWANQQSIKHFLVRAACMHCHGTKIWGMRGHRWERKNGVKTDQLKVVPLNMISSNVLQRVKTALPSISSSPIPLNLWTEFSSWQDFRVLLHTGSKLSIHRIVKNLRRELEAIENVIFWNHWWKWKCWKWDARSFWTLGQLLKISPLSTQI